MEWLALVIGAVVGGGGVFGFLAARGQLNPDRTKHEDELAAPKRHHRLTELQAAATALSDAIESMMTLAEVTTPTWEHTRKARTKVQIGWSAVASYGGEQASDSYRKAMKAFDNEDEIKEHPGYVVRTLQDALRDVHGVISDL